MHDRNKVSFSHFEKTFKALELIASAAEPLTVSSLASQLSMGQARTGELLEFLVKRGFLEEDKESGSYRTGVRCISFAQIVNNNLTVLKYARPIMQSLEKEHDEAVYIAVLKETEVIFLDMVDSEQPVKAPALLGRSFPFFSNAAGKVIAACEPRDYLHRYLQKVGRKRPAVDLEHLQQELISIRNSGVAVDNGGLGEQITSVAVAIRDYAGKVLGALTLIGPTARMVGERLEREIIPSMVAGTQMLSARFGYAAP